MLKASDRAMNVEYAIRDVILPAKKLEDKGIQVLKLNIGDPGKFDFDAPEHMKRSYCDAIMNGFNYYGDSEGESELRESIVKREKDKNGVNIGVDDVQITTGISEAINLTFGALIDGGEEILMPGPSYPPYSELLKFYSGEPLVYETVEDEDWQPDVEDMREKITEDTKAIVVINPNNPTGALYDKKTLKKIIDLAGEHEIPVISDEIYDLLTYEGEHVSPVSLSEDVPVIVFNGFSKVYFATGWRLGYLYIADSEGELDEVKEAIEKLSRVRLCPNTPGQKGANAGLTGSMDYLEDNLEKLEERRDFAYKRLNEIENIRTQKPKGAFYIFPEILGGPWKNDKEFVLDVLDNAHVLFVHGSGFGEGGERHFRSVFLPPIGTLEKAFDKLDEFMKKRL